MNAISRQCALSGRPFIISEWAQEFLKKFDAPLPTLHPVERHRRRIAFRNERQLYRRKCDWTGQDILSIYSPDKPYKVYSQEVYNSDQWDATEYGRDYDFNRPFFEQFHELLLATPQNALNNLQGENSEYCNNTVGNKNCYLVFGGDFNEDCYNSLFPFYCTDSSDLLWSMHCELSFDSVNCSKCYNVAYSQYSHNCGDSKFLYECKGCRDCFGCVGLRNKQYCIFNQQYSKEDYEAKLAEFKLDTCEGVQAMKEQFRAFLLTQPHRFAQVHNSENSTGDYLNNCRNCINCFVVDDSEDLEDCAFAGWAKDCYSCSYFGHQAELYYEIFGSIGGQMNAFGVYVWNCSDTRYSYYVQNSQNLFGCVGLNRKEYCILNKQYSKEDYEALVPKIIEHMKSTGEWGEFFPMWLSPFAYNETAAQDFFPLTQEQALAWGLKWMDKDMSRERPFNLIKQELRLYEKLGVPAPVLAPEVRHLDRLALRNPLDLWNRQCSACKCELQSSFAPNRPEQILCESCYLAQVG